MQGMDRQLAEQALEVVRETGSLRQACLRLGFDRRTFMKLCDQDPEFHAAYARAKADGIDSLVEETIELADEPPPSTAAGSVDTGAVAHAKLRIETRRWLAERLAPRKYGVLQKLEHSGPDGAPVQQSIVITTGVPSDDDDTAGGLV